MTKFIFTGLQLSHFITVMKIVVTVGLGFRLV